MVSRASALAAAAMVAAGCASTIPLSPTDRDRLRDRPPVPVAWVSSGEPWVDCPGDEGRKTWEYPASDARDLAGGPWIRPASATVPAPPVVLAGGTWDTIVEQWTRPLRVPPVDPALATARSFLERRRASGDAVDWSGTPVEVPGHSLSALRSRFPDGPVLVFRAVDWELVGCFYTFRPWFEVRATLVDTSTGRVLWRAECDDTYPGDLPGEARASEMEANGRALYRRFLEGRARQCAETLARTLPAR
jgi:hypothetical protein